MGKCNTVVGLDVHKDTVVAAEWKAGMEKVGEVRILENRPSVVEKTVKRLWGSGDVEFVYEAGPCGYELYRQLTKMGLKCAVIAPGKTPVKVGDRVKTDRRDAEKLARLWRAGELTEVQVPTVEQEADRDLVRVREDLVEDRLRARQRLSKFLLRQGRVFREGKAWGVQQAQWLKGQNFGPLGLLKTFEAYQREVEEKDEHLEALTVQVEQLASQERYSRLVKHLRCLKGIKTLSALTLSVESLDMRRFPSARDFMGYAGLGICEGSTGGKIRRLGITKTGNAHLRRILVEAAWSYRHGKVTSRELRERRKDCPAEILKIARKAQNRLSEKFQRLLHYNKPSQKVVVAVARELAGFVWAIGQATLGEKV